MCGLILRTGAFCTPTADSISPYGVYYAWCGPVQSTQPSCGNCSRMPPRAASAPGVRKTGTFTLEITTDHQGRGPGCPVGYREGGECGSERLGVLGPASSGRRDSVALTAAGQRSSDTGEVSQLDRQYRTRRPDSPERPRRALPTPSEVPESIRRGTASLYISPDFHICSSSLFFLVLFPCALARE